MDFWDFFLRFLGFLGLFFRFFRFFLRFLKSPWKDFFRVYICPSDNRTRVTSFCWSIFPSETSVRLHDFIITVNVNSVHRFICDENFFGRTFVVSDSDSVSYSTLTQLSNFELTSALATYSQRLFINVPLVKSVLFEYL